MADQRIERLESKIRSLKADQERSFKDMMDSMQQMFAVINTCLNQARNNRENGESFHTGKTHMRPFSNGSSGFVGTYLPRMVKLDFPKFNGEKDPTSWECREEDGIASWDDFKSSLHTRYGPTQFHDFFGDLTKLQQTGSVQESQTQFERLLIWAGRLTPLQQVGCFISELKESIKMDVQTYQSVALTAAIRLARIYEHRHLNTKKAVPNEPRKIGTDQSSSSGSFMPIKRLSPVELSERLAKGLCFNCNKKYSPGRRK
ncbi:hypothetical protein AMTRI_Chr08g161340 [Amborella trichopoda]